MGAIAGTIDSIASQPIVLIGIAIFLTVNGIHMVQNIIYADYSPAKEAQYQKEYEQLKQEAIKVKPKRKLNYSVCPVCNAPVDNSRDDCKYCGSLYV